MGVLKVAVIEEVLYMIRVTSYNAMLTNAGNGKTPYQLADDEWFSQSFLN